MVSWGAADLPPLPAMAGLVCTIVSLVFLVVGLVTPQWIDTGTANWGLWKYCIANVCTDLPSLHSTVGIQTARACGIIGVLSVLSGAIVGFLHFCCKHKVLSVIAISVSFQASVWILLQFAIFAGDTSRTSYSYSFYLTLVAFLLCLTAGVCFLLARLTATSKVETPKVEVEEEVEEVKEEESAESTQSKLSSIRAFWKHPQLD